MAAVSSCPKTKAEFFKASERIGCGNDINGHNQYICIPNQEKTSLVELCYNEIMGVREKGNCLEATVGKVIEHACENFVSGCPNATFFDYGFYTYPACQNINTKDNCYVMDPSCPSVLPDDIRCTNNDDVIVYACSILGGVIVLLIAVLIIIIIRYREHICTCFPDQENGNRPPGSTNVTPPPELAETEQLQVKPPTGKGGQGDSPGNEELLALMPMENPRDSQGT